MWIRTIPRVGLATVDLTPSRYVSDSDAVIASLVKSAKLDLTTLPTFADDVEGASKRHLILFRERMKPKRAQAR